MEIPLHKVTIFPGCYFTPEKREKVAKVSCAERSILSPKRITHSKHLLNYPKNNQIMTEITLGEAGNILDCFIFAMFYVHDKETGSPPSIPQCCALPLPKGESQVDYQ